MMQRVHTICVLVLLSALIAGSHFTKSRLDALRPKEGFRELLYLPRGTALKVFAFGFDAPLADLLWLRGQLYYSDNLRAIHMRHERDAKYRYVYQLYDVISELAPRYGNAYLYGGIYLFTTGQPKHIEDGIRLLKKGVRAYDEAARSGRPVTPDIRWRLLIHIANAYDQQLGDMQTAIRYFQKAVEQENCPESIIVAYAGFRQQLKLGVGALERYDTMIAVWEEMLAQMRKRNSPDDTLEKQIETRLADLYAKREQLRQTRNSEKILTRAYKQFRADKGRLPQSIREVIGAGYLEQPPPFPFFRNNGYNNSPDWWMVLPDSSVRSYILCRIEADFMLERLFDAVSRFFNRHDGHFPGSLEMLVKEGILQDIPQHPLAALGYRLTYDPRNGELGVYDPEVGRILPMGERTVPGQTPPPVQEAPEQKEATAPGGETSAKPSRSVKPVPAGHVRVAAVQYCPVFGEPETNRRALEPIVRQAAGTRAAIVVLPEACIPGYADITNDVYWTSGEPGDGLRDVREVAEPADGESWTRFSALADELDIYLTIPIIESAGEKFYITVLLADPAGTLALHHRKHHLWTQADGEFASEGSADPPVADTPYDRLGVMICRDMVVLPEKLAAKNVDIVLHSAAFYGPNFEGYLMANKFTRRFTEPGMHWVLANRSVREKPFWGGYGMSRVMRADGTLLSRVKHDLGNGIVIADLPLKEKK